MYREKGVIFFIAYRKYNIYSNSKQCVPKKIAAAQKRYKKPKKKR